MKSVEVSIIIPVYNSSSTMERALQSLREQTFKKFEVIIIDDCSSELNLENQSSVIKKYEKFLNIIYLKNKSRKGVALSRNIAANQAKGHFLTFLDSDDSYKRDHLNYRYSLMKERPILDYLWGGCDVINGSSLVIDIRDSSQYIDLNDFHATITGLLFFKKEVFVKMKGFNKT